MGSRLDLLVGALDLGEATGLEIGPLTNPAIQRRHGPVRYLDQADTDTLRARYGEDAAIDVDAIVEVDYATGGRSIGETVGSDAPFDYVVASHVIEHVPDVIAWLDDIRSVLRDGGQLSLAIPDHRHCFDTLRSPTVLADLVEAHLRGASRPSHRQVFDHYSSAVAWHGHIAWSEEPPFDQLTSVHSEQEAAERAAALGTSADTADDGHVHCWTFTPRSFQRVVAGLQRLGQVSFRLESCSDVIDGEFFAILRATSRDEAWASAPAVTGVEELRASEAGSVRAELNSTRRQLEVAQTELDAMLRSRSWRITAPLRSLNAARQRLR